MNLEHKTRILAGVAFAQVEAEKTARRFGWIKPSGSLLEQTALIHRDASKVLEISVMGDGPSQHLKDCTRMEEALADVVIHCLTLGACNDLHLAPALLSKLEYNEALSLFVKKDF